MIKSLIRIFKVRTKKDAASELAVSVTRHTDAARASVAEGELLTAKGTIRALRLERQKANARADQQTARADGLVDQLSYSKKDRERLAEVAQQALSTAERLKKELADSLEANRKLQISLDVSRDRREALVTRVNALHSVASDAAEFLRSNSSGQSEARLLAIELDEELNN